MSNLELVKTYIGNCTNLFDENGNCLFSFFRDVSDFACQLENATEIKREEFMDKVYIHTDLEWKIALCSTFYQLKNGIFVAYDEDDGIHYIWS